MLLLFVIVLFVRLMLVPTPAKMPPPSGELAPARAGWLSEMVELVMVTVVTVLPVPLVRASPPPSPSAVVLPVIRQPEIASVPVPLPSQSNAPPRPSPLKPLVFLPNRMVNPERLVAKALVNVGLIEKTLSIPAPTLGPA